MTKTLLYIDDDCRNIIDILNLYGRKEDYDILHATSVETGIEMFQKYEALISTVLLDMSFPNNQLQGKDALIRLKEINSKIPVIILTGSDSAAEIGIAIECIKLGAYDYILKSKFDPQHLFIQFEKAITEANLKAQVKVYQSLIKPEQNINSLLITEKSKNAFDGSITFHLSSLVTIQTESQEDKVNSRVYNWHHTLFNSILLGPSDLTYSLIFNNIPTASLNASKINVILKILAAGKSKKEVEQKLLFFENHLAGLFETGASILNKYYYFTRSTVELVMPKIEDTSFAKFYFQKKTVSETIQNVGFRTQEPRIDTLVIHSAPSIFSINDLLHCLQGQEKETEILVTIKATKLTKQEIDELQTILNRHTGISTVSDDQRKLVKHISNLLKSDLGCFVSEIVLFQKGDSVNATMISHVAKTFFDSLDGCIHFKEYAYNNKRLINRLPQLYSSEDLINIFRFPWPRYDASSGLQSRSIHYDYFPDNFPNTGTVIGRKNTFSGPKTILIGESDLQKHSYILGQTGTGKTTLIFSIIMDLISKGKGVVLIDPHGDLYAKLAATVPKNRKNDLVLFDLSKVDQDKKLNILEFDQTIPEQQSFIFSELIKILDDIYDLKQTGGPMFEMYFRAGVFLVFQTIQGTLVDVVRVFEDREFRNNLLSTCKDPELKRTWNTILEAMREAELANITPYITSKLNRFIYDQYLRPVIQANKSNINFREIMDNSKILLINLPKGKIGDEGVRFFGTILFNRILFAAYSRVNIPEKERIHVYVFLDEFQNFTSTDIGNCLSESRKYKLSLTIANQNLGQLKEKIVHSIIGNVGNFFTFRPGILDAEKLENYFLPTFKKEDLVKIPNYNCVARVTINGLPTQPFIFETIA